MRKTGKNNSLKNIANNLIFKGYNLSFTNQFILIWVILWYFSLFLPWVIDSESSLTWNSFSSLSWNVWFLLIVVLFLPIFTIFSSNYKEKLKLYSNISIKNHFLIITSWLVTLSFWFISINFINWLQTLSKNLEFWNWIVLSLTSWIIILIWWIAIRKSYYKKSSEIILNNVDNIEDTKYKKNNMKLPF